MNNKPRTLLDSALAVAMTVFTGAVIAQVTYTGGTLAENFDGMGPSGASTPFGWYVGWHEPGNTFTTAILVNNGSIAPSQAAGWNFGTTGAADRALGLMATGSSTPAPPGTNRFLEVRIRNSTSNHITTINVRYDGEQWRTGSSATQVNTNVLLFSADGVNFINMGVPFQFVQRVFTPTSTALDGNAAINRTPGIGGNFTLPTGVAPDGIIYLRWFDWNDPSTDPGLAMDNFAFSVPSEAPVTITAQPTNFTAVTDEPAEFSVTANGYPLFYQWFHGDAPIPAATNAVFKIVNTVAEDEGGYFVVVSNQFNAMTSSMVSLALLPQTSFRLVNLTNQWSYNQTGNNLGAAWTEIGFDDSAWPVGRGVLAHESAAAVAALTNTFLSLSNAGNRVLTYYFRTQFVWTNDAAKVYLSASNLVDDGMVVYLNGTEVYRINMPDGPVTYSTLAVTAVGDSDEGRFINTLFPSDHLRNGTNLLAVEVHQIDNTSSDVVFGLSLRAESRERGPTALLTSPRDVLTVNGATTAFSVDAVGTPPLTHQWLFNGVPLPGQTNSSLVISNISMIADGFYSVRASNPSNSVLSKPARLAVDAPDALPLYMNDFQNAVGAEWSRAKTSLTPVGARRFLGDFGYETVTLTLSDLPPHTNVTIVFDLFLIRSWDGSRSPDLWNLTIDGGTPLMQTSFQVYTAYSTQPYPHQAFPYPFPAGTNAAFTGAGEVYSLGYFYNGYANDAVYHMVYSRPHTGGTLRVNFEGRCDETIENESWGLDNVKIYMNAGTVPGWPFISTQPKDQTIPHGSNAVFNVMASAGGIMVHQWRKDGTNLLNNSRVEGANSATLIIREASHLDHGRYSVAISNIWGRTISDEASLAVWGPLRFDTSSLNVQFSSAGMHLRLTNLPPYGEIVLDASTDLVHWTPLLTNPMPATTLELWQTITNHPMRFYRPRVVLPGD